LRDGSSTAAAVQEGWVPSAAPVLASLKRILMDRASRLDEALSSLVYWEVSLPIVGWWELDDLKGPFQPKPFDDSVIYKDALPNFGVPFYTNHKTIITHFINNKE